MTLEKCQACPYILWLNCTSPAHKIVYTKKKKMQVDVFVTEDEFSCFRVIGHTAL